MPTMPAISSRVSDETREGLAHRGHRRAAIVAAEHGARALGVMAGDFGCRYVDADRRLARADIDAQRRDAGGRDRIGEEGQLVALGVRRADHIDALHERHRSGRAIAFF